MSAWSVADAVAAIAAARGQALAVVTMSAVPAWPASDEDYRLMGLMGAATSIGLGLALGRPDRDVWVIDGDGSLLMQLGVLAAVADAAPPNLTHLVIDNGVYAISGAQATPGRPDWARLFTAAGYRSGASCADAAGLRSALAGDGPGPRGIAVRCAPGPPVAPPADWGVRPDQEGARVRALLAPDADRGHRG